MDELAPFEESRRQLLLKRARELSERIDALRSRVSRGEYDDADLAEPASILRSLRFDIVGNDTRLSEGLGLSGTTIAQTYSGKSRPKYPNFMKMLYGAQQILAKEVESGEGIPLSTDRSDVSEGTISEYSTSEPVRIRSERSNIFLNEKDLVRVRELATNANSSISAVIGNALTLYDSDAAKQTASGLEERILIENRVDIVRYSRAIIRALEEAVDYDPKRHHNLPPPALRLDDAGYLRQVGNLVIELRRLNDLLEQPTKVDVAAIHKQAGRFGKHFEKFLDSYLDSLAKGAGALTVAAAVSLLYKTGVSKELIDTIWEHLKLG
jgi:hypothetical protein